MSARKRGAGRRNPAPVANSYFFPAGRQPQPQLFGDGACADLRFLVVGLAMSLTSFWSRFSPGPPPDQGGRRKSSGRSGVTNRDTSTIHRLAEASLARPGMRGAAATLAGAHATP